MENPVGIPNVSCEILQDVPTDVIEEFKTGLKKDFPQSVHLYSFLHVVLEWKKKRPDLKALIQAPFGNPIHGLVLGVITQNTFNGTVYAEDESSAEKLQEALKESKRVPYLTKETVVFTAMSETSFKALEIITTSPDWHTNYETVYWLPWSDAREMDVQVPEGVEMRELSREYAEQINSIWPHKFNDSLELIREMIDVNFGIGVFRGKRLLSWAILWFYGGIGLLHTEEAERRKGYARAVVAAISKQLGTKQLDVHLTVMVENSQSHAFFQALGFKFAFHSAWTGRKRI